MKPVKYTLLLIAILLSPIQLMAMSEDEARDRIKEFIGRQHDFGMYNETLKLTFANINIDDNGVKVIFNKEDDVFNPLFPELTEGKFKTVAQENRYVNHQFGLYILMRESIENPKFFDALKDSNLPWDVFVMNPRQNVPYYTTTLNFRDVENAILINNSDANTDFKTFLSISLVDRALKSLMEQVYISHDSVGISYAQLSKNVLNCTMLTTSDSYPKITATNGMVARNEWIEAFLENCMAKNYYKQLLALLKTKLPTVKIQVEDIHKQFNPVTYTINTYEILAAAQQSTTGGLSAEDYIVQQIGGTKQKEKDHGLFMLKYGDVVNQMKQVAEISVDKSKRVYEVVDEMPEFPGGSHALSNYLYNNVKYPIMAQQNKVQGRVTCEFVITNEGKVINVRISESRDPYLDAEAKRVIAAMPKWIPGRHHGERVNTRYSVPVTFTLPN
ncbi:MAG: energy transducer TonB [Prevotella sp.]|nr:energy transducer TonB [Prevotella sp.]